MLLTFVTILGIIQANESNKQLVMNNGTYKWFYPIIKCLMEHVFELVPAANAKDLKSDSTVLPFPETYAQLKLNQNKISNYNNGEYHKPKKPKPLKFSDYQKLLHYEKVFHGTTGASSTSHSSSL
jgi:hypothetical protein